MLRPVPIADTRHILEHAEPLWRELRGQHLFITGGTGFFGIWLLEALRAANNQFGSGISVTVLSRDPAAFATKAPHLANESWLHWHRGDIRNFPFPHTHYDQIIHAATASSAALNECEPSIMLDTIVAGTQRVLEFAAQRRIESFLLTSSGAVYGRQPPELLKIPESFTGSPNVNSTFSAYAEGKRMAELLCALASQQYGISTKIARCFTFVGPHLPLNTHFAAGNFLRDAIAGGPIIVKGDGTAYRSYMHPADLVVWLLTILVHGQSNRPYNVGSGECISVADLAYRIASFSAGNPLVQIHDVSSIEAATRYVPQTERARSELNLDILVDLDGSLRRTLDWLRGALWLT